MDRFPFQRRPSLSPRSIELTNQNASVGFAFSLSWNLVMLPRKQGGMEGGLGE